MNRIENAKNVAVALRELAKETEMKGIFQMPFGAGRTKYKDGVPCCAFGHALHRAGLLEKASRYANSLAFKQVLDMGHNEFLPISVELALTDVAEANDLFSSDLPKKMRVAAERIEDWANSGAKPCTLSEA